MTKIFVLRAQKAWTRPDGIDLSTLPKHGKLDMVCATISSALWISDDVRRDTVIHVVLECPPFGPKTISFFGNEIKGLRSDEVSIGSYIKDALTRGVDLKLGQEKHVRAGIKIAKKSYERLVWELSKEAQVFVLDEQGKDVRKAFFNKGDIVFLIGSVEGLPSTEESRLRDMKAERIKLGPKALFASHCPILIHNELDRRGL
ncbi:MAG: hypothetical protein ABIA21_01755 [Candidatus Aenigmatarchaeota archaeon]